jgi:hypothetical protein
MREDKAHRILTQVCAQLGGFWSYPQANTLFFCATTLAAAGSCVRRPLFHRPFRKAPARGRGATSSSRFRVSEKSQVVLTFLAQPGDEAGVPFGEAIAELFKLLLGSLGIPGGFDASPPLSKLGADALTRKRFGPRPQPQGLDAKRTAPAPVEGEK